MRGDRCPRCGARLELVGERWDSGDGRIGRTLRCGSCGGVFDARGGGPGGQRGRPAPAACAAAALLWAVVLLAVLWVVLRLLPYGGRAQVYRAASAFVEGFLHPLWLAALVLAGVALFLWKRRASRVELAPAAAVAPDVHLRAEPPGKITAVISDSRGAAVRDFVVERSPEAEERILAGLRELAARSAAFDHAREGGATDRTASPEEVAETQRRIYSLGLEIGVSLLGGDSGAGPRIADLPGDHLLLRIQPELSRIPWELLVPRPGGQFLWQLFHTSRQIRTETAGRTAGARRCAPLRVLLMANLEAGRSGRDLPHAEREAAELLELAASRPDLLKVERKSPRTHAEFATLLSEGFDVVHFAGHSLGSHAGAGWDLGEGEGITLDALGPCPERTPSLVFANTCGTDGGDVGAESRSWDAARHFLEWGVQAYLGTLWDLHDGGSARFAGVFYRRLAAGATLAAAVSAARSALLGVEPVTWANYVLYGDPALVVAAASGPIRS